MENRLRVNPGNGLECRQERRQKQQRHRDSAHELPKSIQCSQLLSHLYLSPFKIEIFIAKTAKNEQAASFTTSVNGFGASILGNGYCPTHPLRTNAIISLSAKKSPHRNIYGTSDMVSRARMRKPLLNFPCKRACSEKIKRLFRRKAKKKTPLQGRDALKHLIPFRPQRADRPSGAKSAGKAA